MYKYILKRLITLIPVIIGVSFLVYVMLDLAPGNVLDVIGEELSAEELARLTKELALDRSVFYRYFLYMKLTAASVVVGVVLSLPLGIKAAVKSGSLTDNTCTVIGLLGLSIPNFWLGLMLILYFSINLGILPATYQPGNNLTLIMPAIVLGTGMSASVARMTRSSMLEVKNADYILTARAKGLPENRVVMKHILGNAMIPIITTIGGQFGGMLGGSSVTEKVFNINGIGSYIVERQYIPDIPVVLAGVVYISFIVSIMNLVVDIMYAVIDPRIKSRMKNY